MKVTIHSAIKHETSSQTLPEVFSVADVNARAVALAHRVYRANARQGTAKTKTRGEVTMTGKKVYKQKGTGGARHGSKRAPIFVGGGVTFGPHGNQNWSLSLPQRQKLRALQQAFSLRSQATSLMIDLEKANGKTKTFAKAFDRIDENARSFVMVLAPAERELVRGLRNLAKVTVCFANQITSTDVIKADRIVLSQQAVDLLVSRFAPKKKSATPAKTKTVAAEAEEPAQPVKKAAPKKSAARATAKRTTAPKRTTQKKA